MDILKSRLIQTIVFAALTTIACGRVPGEDTLRDSFSQQLASNRFITDFQRNGDELTFSGPGAEGGTAKWRVRIESAAIEANDDEAMPFKGTIKSSWYSDGQLIQPEGRDSRLPIELMFNGVSQDCWAFWDAAAKRWSWE